ncbi:AP2 domain-containing protein [Streptomyces sp. NPDC093223]|uniref:AP2 domain-containing protein n=1 Tax=Streptomyces sp. NPDC093223 TaxID=3366033 RepID=UPI003805DD20
MPPKVDLAGKTFGRLTVIEEAGRSNADKVLWRCLCECGTETTVVGGDLRSGRTTTCGCGIVRAVVARSRTHGQSRTRLYRIWCAMATRTTNPNSERYADYGGRGITMCPEWRASFETFARDMGPTYADGLTIDRINVDGNYEPSNCRWATYAEQARNTRRTRYLTFLGQTKAVSEWNELLGLKPGVVLSRIDDSGWSIERALTAGADPDALASLRKD